MRGERLSLASHGCECAEAIRMDFAERTYRIRVSRFVVNVLWNTFDEIAADDFLHLSRLANIFESQWTEHHILVAF